LASKEKYKCDPTDEDRPCKIFYTNTLSFDTPCACSLGEPDVGYCDSIIGTPEYADALSSLKKMHVKANVACHTLDRDNMLAQIYCNTQRDLVEPAMKK